MKRGTARFVRWSGGAALLVATALFCAVVAVWVWQAFGPKPLRVATMPPTDPAAAILASGLWSAPGKAAASAPAASDDRSLVVGDTRLLGVIAERNGAGYALFRLPAGARVVAAGQEIAPGATLVAVRPDGITLRDAGGERVIQLRPEAAKPRTAMTPPAPSSARGTRAAACALPPGFRGTVLRVNAELFQGIIAKPESWSALVTPDRGGLLVSDRSGFVAMLAMEKGDRLLQANGIALAVPDDIVAAVLKPLAASQSVRINGVRAGAQREWLLLNAGTCPG